MTVRQIAAAALLAAACSSTSGTEISMSFARAALYDAPFPSDDLVVNGHVDLSKVPNPNQVVLIQQALALLDGADGFAQSGAIYFRAGAPLDPTSLPDANGSVAADASVFVVGVGAAQPDLGKRHPLDVAFLADGGPFGAPDLLALLPIQGIPFRPRATYAAVVTTRVRDARGHALAPSATMQDLVAGRRPAALSADAFSRYRAALAALAQGGVDLRQIAALAVFTTGDPTAGLAAVRDDMLAHALPTIAPPSPSPTPFPDYCIFQSSIQLPVYQAGQPPYDKTGGAWAFGGDGKPIVDHTETARVFFTVPRAPMPAGGWPTVVFVRTGGGGDLPLTDRGVSAGGNFTGPIVPGSGPAMDLARVGFAGVQVDGPLGGIRNTTGGDEDFLIFNVFNPAALRDNIRQSAAELILFAHALAAVRFDASSCPGASAFAVDGAHLALMGHSMGAWIAPLTLAFEPRYGASVLSGAGGSYVANIMDKIKPTHVRPILEILLDFNMDQRSLERHDPALTLVQWAAEPSDPQVYDARIVDEPAAGEAARHVLMIQGIVDHYILPSIANATSLALGLDQAGPAYDAGNAEEMTLAQTPLGALLPLAGRSAIALPVTGNVGGATTAVVVQHPGDAVEDGHEVMFQTEPPKHQYRCFLSSWLHGTPSVPPDGAEDDPCP